MTKYITIIQLKTKEMEAQQNPENLKVSSLAPEAIASINSYDVPEEVKSDFREMLKLVEPQSQMLYLMFIGEKYQDILQELIKTLNLKMTSFTYESKSINDCLKYCDCETEEELLKWFRKYCLFDSLIYDCFIKLMSKDDMLENIKQIVKKENDKWCIYITCNIEYP